MSRLDAWSRGALALAAFLTLAACDAEPDDPDGSAGLDAGGGVDSGGPVRDAGPFPDTGAPGDADAPGDAADPGEDGGGGTRVVLFHSDWRTEVGRTQAAFRDTAQTLPWLTACCDSSTNSSISTAASLGLTDWPTANVYRVGTLASSPTMIPTHALEVDLGPPAAGESRYFRYYLQVNHGDAHGDGQAGNLEHGVETAESGGGDGMTFFRIPRADGTWFPAYRETSTGQRYVATGLDLLKHATYRLEWVLHFGATTYTVEVRIYDGAGNLVATDADYHRLLPSPEDPAALLGDATFAYTAAHHQLFRVGTNGPGSNFPLTALVDQDLFLHGAVAVCSGTWCGPYADGI